MFLYTFFSPTFFGKIKKNRLEIMKKKPRPPYRKAWKNNMGKS